MGMTLKQQHEAAKQAEKEAISNQAEGLFNDLKRWISQDLNSNPPVIKYAYDIPDGSYTKEALLVVKGLMLDQGVDVGFSRKRGSPLVVNITYLEEK